MSSDDNNNSVQSSSSNAEEADRSGFFIDDYSHLRLSYHRELDDTAEYVDSSFTSQQDDVEAVKEIDEETERRNKLRAYWVSQMPDLPHPAVTMAAIISSASKKMGMVQLNYNDRIEQGQGKNTRIEEEKFSPSRRSTMNCKQLPK